MLKLIRIKAILLFFILGIVVFGCQNTTNNSTSNETSLTSTSAKVYKSVAVEGMTCGGCEKTVQGALTAIDGVDSAFASHVDKQVRILVDTSKVNLQDIQQAINDKGYTAGDFIK
ncbi:MAG: heavy-metal-associated domain-containing protein [Bacteroidales bacterium]|nr:heavy-metal-associated domain-containing protein [Bacteroidales bacterium]